MSTQNTIKISSGDLLTGKLWRKSHPFFNDLPFHCDVARMDEIAGTLEKVFREGSLVGTYTELLLKLAKGLDEGYPFSDTVKVDVVLREAEVILFAHEKAISRGNASRIWAFMTKFVMLDRFSRALGVAAQYPGIQIPKRLLRQDRYFGSADRFLHVLNPPTKVLDRFLKTWAERENTMTQYSSKVTHLSSDSKDTAGIALSLSRRLITVVKARNIVNIEAGLEMVALAMAISSENNGVFPELAVDVKNVLTRIWSDRMEPEQLEEVSNGIQALHRSIKNVAEIVFAISPLLALSTHGWASISLNSIYLLRMFEALGNERPQILIQLEDCVLKGIIAISEGKPREEAMHTLYSQLLSLKKDLDNDENALTWFYLPPPIPPPIPQFPTTPLARNDCGGLPLHMKEMFLGGLASPPNTRVNSPIGPLGSASTSQTHCSLRFLNPRDFDTDCVEVDDDATVFDMSRPSSPFGDDNSTIVDESMNPLEIMQEDGAGESKELQSHPQEDESRNPLKITQEDGAGKSMELPSHPQEDDSTMVDVESTPPSSPLRDGKSIMVDESTNAVKIRPEDGAGKSMELPSHPQEDDSTMFDVESTPPSSPLRDGKSIMVDESTNAVKIRPEDGAGDDDSTMYGVESRPPSPPPSPYPLEDAPKIMQEDGAGDDESPMDGVESRPPSPHPLEDDDPIVSVQSGEPLNDMHRVGSESSQLSPRFQKDGVESRPPSPRFQKDSVSIVGAKSREPLLDDANEDDVEGLPMNEDKSSDALGHGKIKRDAIVVVGSKGSELEKVDEQRRSGNGFRILKTTPKNGVDSMVVDESNGSLSGELTKGFGTAKATAKNGESNGSSSGQLGKGFQTKGFGYIKATQNPAIDFSSMVDASYGSSSDGSFGSSSDGSSSDESTGSSSVLSAKASRTAKATHNNIESPVMAASGLRRSSRILSSKNMPIVDYVDYIAPRKPTRGKKKAPFENGVVLPQANFRIFESDYEDGLPQLSGVEKATFHPTLYADIAGWGSTVEAGPKPYRHVPVQIVPPGDPATYNVKTGDDTETLRIVEAFIQAKFKNGLPPHLQPDAKSRTYTGGDQSRIFVASHSEFSNLHASDIQNILRNRLILVHGNPLDYTYGWDLASLGRLYDVDGKISVHVLSKVDPQNSNVRHYGGTLRDFHKMTTSLSNKEYPPINAISLPSHRRNLYVPSQFGAVASHEVAQSRLPRKYETSFDVPDIKSQMEWSLVGAKGAISPFHMDSAGFGTMAVVLEGSKYWIVVTRMGEHDTISSVDSLGPGWTPYFASDGDEAKRFSFEGVHLQKGDMLIMPGGVPHWVVSTSNAICAGRHFYSKSTIRSSVIANVHTFLMRSTVTNQELALTRTLLYQLMVFWSTRLDIADVDGAHIPDLSSAVELFDFLYLGVFVILSLAFDDRLYYGGQPPTSLLNEAASAISHFQSVIHIFGQRFIVVLEGESMSISYVVERMLGEFAAASVVLAKSIYNSEGYDSDDEVENRISMTAFVKHIESILQKVYPEVFPYYVRCLDHGHKDFIWTGPDLQIFPRSDPTASVISFTRKGDILDLPSHQIYTEDVDSNTILPDTIPPGGKRRGRADSLNCEGGLESKRCRKS